MAYFVYIIRSRADGTLYKGITSDYVRRLSEHNSGRSRFTRHRMPWDLVYVELHETKTSALIRERRLKRSNRDYLLWLIEQPSNILLKRQ